MRYAYKAVDSSGKSLDGYMEAAAPEEVGSWLSNRSYFVLEIKEAPLQTVLASDQIGRIAPEALNFFLLQLASLTNAGCPLLLSLKALSKQASNRSLKLLAKDLYEKIEAGKSFSEGLRAHRSIFSNLFITLVEVAELGGILGEVLERYAALHDSIIKVRAKTRQAMIYPAILLIMTITVASALLTYVMPQFIERLNINNESLPGLTRFVLGVSHFITGYFFHILAFMVIIGVLYYIIRSTPKGAYKIDSLFITLPGLGPVLKRVQLAMFARIFGNLLRCGVPVLTALKACKNAISNLVYKAAIEDMHDKVSRGETVSVSMKRFQKLFPESICLMALVGEQTGNMGAMLEKAGAIYERELEMLIDTLVSLLNPALVIFMSVFIVILALAMYLPLFDLVKLVR